MTEEFKEIIRCTNEIIHLPEEELDKFLEERKKLNENSPSKSAYTLTDEDKEDLWIRVGTKFVKHKDYYNE